MIAIYSQLILSTMLYICVHHLFVFRLDFVSFVLSAMLLYVYTIYLFIQFRVDFVSFVFFLSLAIFADSILVSYHVGVWASLIVYNLLFFAFKLLSCESYVPKYLICRKTQKYIVQIHTIILHCLG